MEVGTLPPADQNGIWHPSAPSSSARKSPLPWFFKRNSYWTPTILNSGLKWKKKFLVLQELLIWLLNFKESVRKQQKHFCTFRGFFFFFFNVDQPIWNWLMTIFLCTCLPHCVNAHTFALWKDWNRCFMWQWFVNLSWEKMYFYYYCTFMYSECLQC